jgi:site-specific DNA recombinase
VDAVVVAKLDRLTRSVKDLADLLERFNRCGVALISISESLDTQSAAGRLVLNIMTAVSQWEREAIGERTRDAMRHKKAKGERVGNIPFGTSFQWIGNTLSRTRLSRLSSPASVNSGRRGTLSGASPRN